LRFVSLGFAFFAALATAAPAEAVVYCKQVGVPKGCVARPSAGVGVRPGVGAGAPGVGVRPGVGAGAPGVGVRPGVGVNAGGPVNRRGVR
jgi:hypothetical protein